MSPDPIPVVKYYEAVLKLPNSNDKLIIYLKGIYDKMTADSRYAGSSTRLALFTVQIVSFDKAEVGFNTTPPTVSKIDRDDCKKAVIITAKGLRSDVQELADADNGHAESLITGANMSVKIHTPRQKQKSKVKDTNQSGAVIVYGEGEGPHEWMQCDDGENYVSISSTLKAKKKVTGLVVGKKYYFISRQILPRDEYGPWSLPVDVVAR